MTTELDSAIRDALRSRAAAVRPRETELRRHKRGHRWRPPALAAAAVVVLVAVISLVAGLRSHDPAGPSASPAANAVGYQWRLTVVDDPYGRLVVPSSLHATVGFTRDGSIDADDTVNAESGRYRLTGDGYSTSDFFSTSVGFAGAAKSARVRVIAAIASVLPTEKPTVGVSAHVAGDVLTLHGTGGRVLTLRRDGPQPDPSSASPTPTATR